MTEGMKRYFSKDTLNDSRTLMALWALLAIISGIIKFPNNNYKIFQGVFWHAIHKLPLYGEYPTEYFDQNYYGPLFSLVIAPFALCPTWLGFILWEVAMTLCLYFVIRQLPMDRQRMIFLLWFCSHELLTALFMAQFNIIIAAIIVGTWICIEKERDWAATLLIVIGTFVKLYGIVGLAFFLFSKHKGKFILSLIAWSAVAFVLPMLISSPDYICNQYAGWLESLTSKNAENADSIAQNISLLGMVRRCGFGLTGSELFHTYSDLCLLVPGCLLFALPYLRFKQWKHQAFRYAFLASTLLFVVLFSTGSESSGYITPFIGVCIWYWTAPWKRGKWAVAAMAFVFILSSMSPSDLFPAYVRKEIVQPYALKALPCVIVWFWLVWEMLTRDYRELEIED